MSGLPLGLRVRLKRDWNYVGDDIKAGTWGTVVKENCRGFKPTYPIVAVAWDGHNAWNMELGDIDCAFLELTNEI